MKHIVITGSTRGIGFGLASSFLDLGSKVTVNGSSGRSVDTALKKLSKKYDRKNFQGFPGNVCNYENINSLWKKASKSFGEIDIWINNAGIGQEHVPFWKTDIEQDHLLVDVNIKGVMNGSLVAFKNMLKQEHGQIFNSEGFGNDGRMQDRMTVYGMSKRAVRYFSRSLAKEARNTPVQVGSFSPGMVITDFLLKPLRENRDNSKQSKKIFNILADKVETVTPFLAKKILENTKNGTFINWLTTPKIMWRFLTAGITKRRIINNIE